MKKLLFLFILIPILSLSQTWEHVNNFPFEGVHHPVTFSYGDDAYVVTGSNTDNVYKYDSSTDSWTQLNPFPGGIRGFAYGVAVGSKAYIGFGSDSNSVHPNDWWEYDMPNNSWTQLASFPGAGRDHPAMVNVGDKIFVGCGSNASSYGLSDWWEYNITNNSWSQKTDIPGNGRHHPYYFGIGNYAYVGFGHGSVSGPGSNPNSTLFIYNDFYRYDPSNDSWQLMSQFPSQARVAGTQFSYQGKGYILSGDGDNHYPLGVSEFWEYDPVSDSWVQLPPHPGNSIWAPGSFVIGCNVYFLLGNNKWTYPFTFPKNIYKYRLGTDCGCTDPVAVNYSNQAIQDDGSCCYISGCTDPYSINYDSTACFDNGSCVPAVLGCNNPNAINFNPNANTLETRGGELDTSFGLGGFFGVNSSAALILDANEDCVLKSAVFYAQFPNSIKFEIRDSIGNIIDDTTLNVVPGKQRLTLNFEIPAGQSMRLGIGTTGSFLYRNRANTSYPYDIGDLITIKTSTSAWWPNQFYYFYYDMIFQKKCNIPESYNCVSVGNCQDPGDGSGQYTSLSQCVTSCVSTNIDELNEEINVYPNPANNFINFDGTFDEATIYNIFGNKIISSTKTQIDISQLSNGIYFIKIRDNDRYVIREFVITKNK